MKFIAYYTRKRGRYNPRRELEHAPESSRDRADRGRRVLARRPRPVRAVRRRAPAPPPSAYGRPDVGAISRSFSAKTCSGALYAGVPSTATVVIPVVIPVDASPRVERGRLGPGVAGR